MPRHKLQANFKPGLDRSKMTKSMQLGAFECPGSCGCVYKTQASLKSHERKCLKKNKAGESGQNGCWQPGYK